MNLVIDVGNSLTKFTLFNNSNIECSHSIKTNNIVLKQIKILFPISNCNIIICSVKNIIPKNILSLEKLCKKLLIFNLSTYTPILNLYKSKSLGLDRLAAAVGANTIFPNTNCLIIDAGTAITYDILTKNNEYLGGAISPGIDIRYKALSVFTNKLPDLNFVENFSYPANNTNDSINVGINKGILFETEGYINELSKKYKKLKVIVTGGNYNFLVKNIKRTIFAQQNLVAIGLNKILEFNEI